MHPAFQSIIGQPDAIDYLSRALVADRLPHGLVFAGPVGTGRYTTAVALAKIFLAERPNDPESLDAVSPLVEARTHPDFHYVTKEQVRELEGKSANKAIQFSIDVVRERILVPAGRKSALGRGKVFVVEEAEAMTIGAQNALLKTLEEPSGRTLIVLLSDQPHALLSTIRSRAQTVRFSPMNEADAVAILQRHNVESAQATAAVRLAGGSPGLALRWIQDGVTLHAAALANLLSGKGGDLAAFFKTASEEYAKRQLDRDPAGSEDGFKRAGVNVYLRIASDRLRERLAAGANLDRTCEQIDAIRRAETYIDGNVNLALVLQQLGTALT